MPKEEFHRRLIAMLSSGEIGDKADLQRAKIRLCRELKLAAVPANSDTIERLDEETFRKVEDIIKRKPVRTMSGVAVVATMTSPAPCPHGKCIYCPGGVESNSPQSYTGKEPAARRAIFNEYDPIRQTRARIEQLEAIGHDTDKIDLIVMGGTFTSRPLDYQTSFVMGCFEAMNERPSETLEEAHAFNETAPHRCIGMTIETRPDSFDPAMADHVMSLGTTRVEFGVQLLDDDILRAVNRGHGVKAVVDATKVAKDKGLKVCYHIMPGLPGSSPEKDMESFRMMFSDERFMPDMLKIYPTLVVEGTKLFEMWQKGEYAPYTTSEAALLIADMKETVPRWARIQRIQRDIPVQLISAGVDKSDLRELACRELARTGRKCHCIRCREVGLMGIRKFSKADVVMKDVSYRASEGEEHFISIELEDRDALVGYARLRLGDGAEAANLRELKVFGQMARIGETGTEAQHRGFGRELMAEAESMAAERGYRSIKVTSGVGVRGYYSVMGYSRNGYHMEKRLD
ncbi:MAG: tRNA uridine(34) 5-carboxymethylaminomethyl modification radical SAM/GNAT enzyme Elp3 [Euryarchaeota archaeon]|nr:tRNA uridine(34) 5-carboxymethylaminomethyl modification radical SAM/GNAT enzyme Elp3 [Euryarchaeota archaeon]